MTAPPDIHREPLPNPTQTFLERVKRLDGSEAPESSKPIPPTVGLNGKQPFPSPFLLLRPPHPFSPFSPKVARLELSGCNLMLWDLGGQVTLRVIWDKYFADSHAVVFVVDSADRERLAEARTELEAIVKHKSMQDAPVLVVVNKQDVESALTVEDVIQKLDIDAGVRFVRFQPTSALEGSGVDEGISWLLQTIQQSPRTARLEALKDRDE